MTTRSIANARGLWFVLFMLSGLPALFSVLLLLFDPLAALPWVVVSWSVLIVSGYRIWRIDHPGESARDTVEPRLHQLLVATAGATGVAILTANPVLVVLVAGGWFIVVALLMLALMVGSRGSREP